MTLNFDGGADDIPTYSFADLRACADDSNKDFFRRQFDGKVVIIGTVLDVEDRQLTSKRFATGPRARAAPRCALPRRSRSALGFKRSTIAGVYIHATAVNNLVAPRRGRRTRRLPIVADRDPGRGVCGRSSRGCSGRPRAVLPSLGAIARWT